MVNSAKGTLHKLSILIQELKWSSLLLVPKTDLGTFASYTNRLRSHNFVRIPVLSAISSPRINLTLRHHANNQKRRCPPR
ncbi:MAG: hypothetical protein RLZZ474_1806 [Bacteroidota bacterium]|jgi:hypothetical protein